MTSLNSCPQCGEPLPNDAPAGLCPKCLVQAAFKSEPAAEPSAGADVHAAAQTVRSPAGLNGGFVPPAPEELAPLFPQLEILKLLGKGGMGAVYKARQPGLDRLVAVKILPPAVSGTPGFTERFAREARALARLSHPHIVAVYDFGETNGLYYFLMEYVDGVNLRQAIQSARIDPPRAMAIVPQICDALQFAHDEGVVHRDIKPENILVDQRGRVKIADFGLAKLRSPEGTGGEQPPDLSLTGTQQVMGTLRYMAPEQMQGSKSVDHRADIYSLGVVFYELLTGEVPIGRFVPPSRKVQVDVRLDEIVLRALETQPEHRYQHASEIKSEVELVTGKKVADDKSLDRLPPVEDGIISKLEIMLRDWWVARSYASRVMLRIALNCVCAFCILAFLSFKGFADTDHNSRFEIGFLDPWFVFESNRGPGMRSVSGIFWGWSWLFGIGAVVSGWLLIKVVNRPRPAATSPSLPVPPSGESDQAYAHRMLKGPAVALMIAAVADILGSMAWSVITIHDARTYWNYLPLVFAAWSIILGFVLLGAARGLLRGESSTLGEFAIACSMIDPPGFLIAIPAVILYWVRCEDPRVKSVFQSVTGGLQDS